MHARAPVVVCLASVLLAGCATSGTDATGSPTPIPSQTTTSSTSIQTPTEESTMSEDPTAGQTPTPSPTDGDAELDEAVEAARADLAIALGVPLTQVSVELAEAIVWPDASLGCPEPGRSYTQAQAPGSRIVLKARGASYSYHGVRGGVPVACDQPQVPPSPR